MIFTPFSLSTQGSIVPTVHRFRDYDMDFVTRRPTVVRPRVRFCVCLGPEEMAVDCMGVVKYIYALYHYTRADSASITRPTLNSTKSPDPTAKVSH